jgi:hypothetical protein
MPRRCLACDHPARTAIDRALVEGESHAAIARRHDLSDDTIRRHWLATPSHVPAELRERLRADRDRLAELSDELVDAALRLLRRRRMTAADLSAAARACEVRARLEGRFGDLQGVRPARRSLLSDADWWAPLVAELVARGAFLAEDDEAA